MSYSTAIRREAGGSVLTLAPTASLNVETGARMKFGDSEIYFGSGLPAIATVTGAIYFRGGSDAGSAANIYVNITNSASTGNVWKGASLFS